MVVPICLPFLRVMLRPRFDVGQLCWSSSMADMLAVPFSLFAERPRFDVLKLSSLLYHCYDKFLYLFSFSPRLSHISLSLSHTHTFPHFFSHTFFFSRSHHRHAPKYVFSIPQESKHDVVHIKFCMFLLIIIRLSYPKSHHYFKELYLYFWIF